MKPASLIQLWQNLPQTKDVLWRAENGASVPQKVLLADDTLSADAAYKLACEGCALLWQGDFQNARQLLQALMRRCDRPAKIARKPVAPVTDPVQLFHLHRQAQGLRARILSKLLIPLNGDYTISLRRAPDVTAACAEAYGASTGLASIVSLRELQSLTGAHEWRKKGVPIAALEANIYPHYGVFSPLRGEYIDLVANASLPDTRLAFDIGTGTGVLAAVLARRGVQKIIATEQDPRAIDCAQENINRLGLGATVSITNADLFPEGRAPLIICNPPWVPARPSSPIEHAIYDPDSRMLRGFLSGLASHLEPQGQGWLLLSDLAEHLGLRTRGELLGWIEAGGLTVIDRLDIKPRHGKADAQSDSLSVARTSEMTSLWRLTLSNHQ